MMVLEKFASQPKSRKLAIFLALFGSIIALPLPIAGIHKFYLGQPLWGLIYLLLWQTPIPRIACAIDAVWYLIQDNDRFAAYFPLLDSPASRVPPLDPGQVNAIGSALRELDRLRGEGLISEYEFEQKRRQLLE
jgi:TM2 domain-containing membrane protein YozV